MDKKQRQYSLQQLRDAWGAGRSQADEIIEKASIIFYPEDVKEIKRAMLNHLNDRLKEVNDSVSSNCFADYNSTVDAIWGLQDKYKKNPRIENVLRPLWRLNEHFYTSEYY